MVTTFPLDNMESEGTRSQNPSRTSTAGSKPLALDYAPTSGIHQNVLFGDMNLGGGQSRGQAFDPLRDDAMIGDAHLEDFFRRPVKIAAFDWAIGSGLDEIFDPWTLYWEDSFVSARIRNFKLLRCKMKVKFILNGNPFYYGRAIASYNPLRLQDNLTNVSTFSENDVVLASQRPHVWLNPTSSAGGELDLPFFTYLNVLDISARDWRTMGDIKLFATQSLKHSNGATDQNVTISVFAWAEEVKYSVVTNSLPGELPITDTQIRPPTRITPGVEPSNDEYGTGPISRPATALSKVAGMFRNVPYIGNFALATQVGASAVSKIASIFGFCRPVQLETILNKPLARSSLANVNLPDEAVKLSVDTKQELTIDPAIAGISSEDELHIASIASRESFLTSFDWAVDNVEETMLFNMVVDPGLHKKTTTPNIDPAIYFPACSYAVQPFEYWKGSFRVRFQIVCSDYHKGRLKITWDPSQGEPAVPYNTVYTTIVDLSERKDFTMDIGWGQPTPFRRKYPIDAFESEMFSTTPISPFAFGQVGNGVIAVYVVNELTTPNSEVDNDIEVNVFISMLDDFEVAAPTSSTLKELYLEDSPPPDPEPERITPGVCPASNELPVLLPRPDPQDVELILYLLWLKRHNPTPLPRRITPGVVPANEEVAPTEVGVTPTDPESIRMVGAETTSDPILNKVHFGEVIGSFRQLIKRYNLVESIVARIGAGDSIVRSLNVFRPVMPYDAGWTSNGTAAGITLPVQGYPLPYVYTWTTLLSYIRLGFAGWRGSVRYIIDGSLQAQNSVELEDIGPARRSFSVSRLDRGGLGQASGDIGSTTLDSDFYRNLQSTFEFDNGHEGKTIWNTEVNPVHTFEIPYYSRYRFAPAKRATNFSEEDEFQPGFTLTTVDVGGATRITTTLYNSYAAAGEDFTCFMYLGPPVFYYRPTRPEDIPPPEL